MRPTSPKPGHKWLPARPSGGTSGRVLGPTPQKLEGLAMAQILSHSGPNPEGMAVQGESQAPRMEVRIRTEVQGTLCSLLPSEDWLEGTCPPLYGDDGTDGIMPQILLAFCAGCGFEPTAQERKLSPRKII